MRHLRGLVTVAMLVVNLIQWGLPILFFGLIKRLLPGGRLRQSVSRFIISLAERWVAGNDRIFDRRLDTVWDVEGID